ncbi:MAG: phosphotransferase [Chloroflexi bacterium]|nr:phosphotransferase [Chloroflexota bacterium]
MDERDNSVRLRAPAELASITPEWLTWALGLDHSHPDVRVQEVRILETGMGNRATAQIARIEVFPEYGSKWIPPDTLVVKLSHSDPEVRREANRLGLYEREARFYQQAAPKGELALGGPPFERAPDDDRPMIPLTGRPDAQSQNIISRFVVPPRTLCPPYCYYAAYDRQTGQSALLLEDLSQTEHGSWRTGCTAQYARLVIEELAGMHSLWWNSSKLDDFDWLYDFRIGGDPAALASEYRRRFGRFLERVGSGLSEEAVDITRNLDQEINTLLRRLTMPPRTLVHNDFQLDNLFFHEHATIATDWQMVSAARGAFDAAYFLGSNLDPVERSNREVDLLRTYHNTLLNNGVDDYTFGECLRDYQDSLKVAFFRMVYATGAERELPPAEQEYYRVLVLRLADAIMDQ